MNSITLPPYYNYIEAYLTYDCNMTCTYCLNHYHQLICPRPMTTQLWIHALKRLPATIELPITLGGGEPTLYPGFYDIVQALPNGTLDLLTNGTFDAEEFMSKVPPERFNRGAKYASIRVSLHPTTDLNLVFRNMDMLNLNGYSIGMWAVDHPTMTSLLLKAHDICQDLGIDFRVKEFLGMYKGKLYGKYKYPSALGKEHGSTVLCKSSELLIAPDGKVFRCHSDLYAYREPMGNILNNVYFGDFMECKNYGRCHPCDIKLKYNRFQKYGHCSVEVKKFK